jgi:hypothetical protein
LNQSLREIRLASYATSLPPQARETYNLNAFLDMMKRAGQASD